MNNIFFKKRLTLNSIDSKSSVKKKQRSENKDIITMSFNYLRNLLKEKIQEKEWPLLEKSLKEHNKTICIKHDPIYGSCKKGGTNECYKLTETYCLLTYESNRDLITCETHTDDEKIYEKYYIDKGPETKAYVNLTLKPKDHESAAHILTFMKTVTQLPSHPPLEI